MAIAGFVVADLKAFCGEHGGIVCTWSNARRVREWSFARRDEDLLRMAFRRMPGVC